MKTTPIYLGALVLIVHQNICFLDQMTFFLHVFLQILSYNIWDRPLTIIHDGQRERTCRIPYWIREHIPDIDIITLQEAFNGGCWPTANFYTLFAELGFPYHTDKLTKSLRLTNGGTIIFSRWPIEAKDNTIYSARRLMSADYFAAKGVNYIKIKQNR